MVIYRMIQLLHKILTGTRARRRWTQNLVSFEKGYEQARGQAKRFREDFEAPFSRGFGIAN
jgi:hypothetical protein